MQEQLLGLLSSSGTLSKMSNTKTVRTNFRVVVEPKRLGDFGWFSMSDGHDLEKNAKEYEDRCEEIIEQIRRHVDWVDSAVIECDTEEVCIYCGHEREYFTAEDEKNWPDCKEGFPACCKEATKNYEHISHG